MLFDEYVDLIPEEKREAFKAIAEKAVDPDEYLSRAETVEMLKSKDWYVKSLQSESDRKAADFEKKFKETKLPELLEAERKKGEKSPEMLKIEELEKQLKEKESAGIREKQINRGMTKANEAGIPVSLVSRFIGEDDEATDAEITELIDVLTKWSDDKVTEALKAIGTQKPPKAGSSKPAMTRAEFNKLPAKERVSYMSSGGTITD